MLEIAGQAIGNVPTAVVAAIVAGILRSLAGYVENVYKDGHDQQYELNKLVGTIAQYFGYILILMMGVPAGPAVAGAFVIDAGKSALVKRG